MKKVVYLAPIFLLSLLGKGVMADQVEHVSSLDSVITQANAEATHKSANSGQDPADTAGSASKSKTIATQELAVKPASSAAFYVANKISDGNTGVNLVNPSQDKVIIHYVDENGQSIKGMQDYTIDLNSVAKGTSQGQFKVPDQRYELPDPTDKYDLQHDKHPVYHPAKTHVVHHPEEGHEESYEIPATGHEVATGTQWTVTGSDGDTDTFDDDMNNHTPGDSMWGTGSGNPGDTVVSATPSTTYTWVEDTPASTGYRWVVDRDAWDETVTDKPAYTTQVGDDSFKDDSKNIRNVIGNQINVILKHKTREVNANSSSLDLNSQRHVKVINGNNETLDRSLNFKVGYQLDLVTNDKIIDLNSGLAQSDPKSFLDKADLSDMVGYDSLNSKLLTLSL